MSLRYKHMQIILDSAYDVEAETTKSTPDLATGYEKISHEDFMKFIRPALHCTTPDTMAIFKVSAIIVFAKMYISLRLPSGHQVPVTRMCFLHHDIIRRECKNIYNNYLKDGPPPADLKQKASWEPEWLKEAFRRHDAEHAVSMGRPAPCVEPPPLVIKVELDDFHAAHAGLGEQTRSWEPVDVDKDPADAPMTPPRRPARAPSSPIGVKKEQFDAAEAHFILGAQLWSRPVASSGAVIDIGCSPSPSVRASQELVNDHAALSPLIPQPDPLPPIPSHLPSPPESLLPLPPASVDPAATWPCYPGNTNETEEEFPQADVAEGVPDEETAVDRMDVVSEGSSRNSRAE